MRIIGVDIGAKYIIAHDGDKAVEISTPLEAQAYIRPNDIVVLEQTGAYGIRWAEVFSILGAKVYIADGRDFKNYRLAHSRKKDDSLDAFYLRKYYQEKPNKCRPYNPQQTHIRALIRQHIRNQKDITKHTNRLKQYLAMIYPTEENHLKHRQTLYNHLDQLITRLKQTPHALSPLAISEAKKLQICLTQAKQLEEEITSIARNHPDYEILKTFPLGDIQIATLLAYSWDINNFPDKEGYIAYVLMGANLEQSGTSIYKVKTDKARTEIKGIYYMLFMKAHQKTHPLHPLARLSRELINTKHNYKKRYIKFLSRFLELTYYARRDRTDYITTLKNKLHRLQAELSHTQRKDLTEYKAMKLYRLTRSINTIKELINTAQRKDILDLGENPSQAPSLFGWNEINPQEEDHENHSPKPNSPKHSHSHSPDPDQSRVCKDLYKPDPDPTGSPMHKRKVEDNTRQRPENNPRDKSPPTGG